MQQNYTNQVSRLQIHPHISTSMTDENRYVPLKSLVGPFDFPMDYFRKRLQIGNQVFGDFAMFESDPEQKAKAFCHKKMMDTMLLIFEELYYFSEKPRKIKAKGVFCFLHTKSDAGPEVDARWLRSREDLSESYSMIDKFSFFIEVVRTNGEEGDSSSNEMSDLDDIVNQAFKTRDTAKRTGDQFEAKKRKVGESAFDCNENKQNIIYNSSKDSCDLSETFFTPYDFGSMLFATVGPVPLNASLDLTTSLCDLVYAPSKMFNANSIYQNSLDDSCEEGIRIPDHLIHFHLGEPCIDLCAGLSFGLLATQFRRSFFLGLGFPDMRVTADASSLRYPDDNAMSASAKIVLDTGVQTYARSSFLVMQQKLLPSVREMVAQCASGSLSSEEKYEIRRSWQTQASIPFKSIFHDSSSVSQSIKYLIHEWEQANDRDHGPGKASGIPIPSVHLEEFKNLDTQQSYLANLYLFAENVGFFCHHSTFIQMLIDSRYACRKGEGKPPHTILFGSPGSGKSHCLNITVKCTQTETQPIFCKPLDNMSALSWATRGDVKNPSNPDTIMTQVCIILDEVKASTLGAGDHIKGEGSDAVAIMKSMCTKTALSYSRNVEILNQDGTKGRGLEEGTITNECAFFGGMNRPPTAINPAFHRRMCIKACLQFERADGVTFEDAKNRETETANDPNINRWIEALRMNSKLHMVVASAEYCGVIKPPCLKIWDRLVPVFKREVESVTSVDYFGDRLAHGKTRLELITRMIAVFETYQNGEDKILTFDQIVAKLPEVEKRNMAGERLCLAVFSSLEDSVFPLMHKIITNAVKSRWSNLEQYDGIVHQVNNVPVGHYTKLPIEGSKTRPKMKEDGKECALRIVFDEIKHLVNQVMSKYKLSGTDDLAKSAIQELMEVKSPDHPTIVWKEDMDGDTNGEISIFFSMTRIANADVTVVDVIKKMTKHATQLMMVPHAEPLLPQFPAYHETGTATGDLLDDMFFKKRCLELHLNPNDEATKKFHPTKRGQNGNNMPHFPKDLISKTNVV